MRERQQALAGEAEGSVRQKSAGLRVGADGALPFERGAVDLRAVPPAGLDIGVGLGPAPVRGGSAVRLGRQNGHPPLGPIIAGRQRDLVRRGGLVARFVAQPIVHHELDPGRGEDIQVRDFLERAAREQPVADQARARLEQRRRRFPEGLIERHVAAEAGARHAHPGFREVVEAPISRPRRANIEPGGVGRGRRHGLGVGEIADPHQGAMTDDHRDRDQERPAVPGLDPAGAQGQPADEPLGGRDPNRLRSGRARAGAPGRSGTDVTRLRGRRVRLRKRTAKIEGFDRTFHDQRPPSKLR
ncbi:hypothetical protein AEGHOMDF_6088 [Methylobacterium soli]|nr:hypothetical protein AEGHOMDF_6088 [Methylobacterium soli]